MEGTDTKLQTINHYMLLRYYSGVVLLRFSPENTIKNYTTAHYMLPQHFRMRSDIMAYMGAFGHLPGLVKNVWPFFFWLFQPLI